jgi:predicted acetyltransferase
MNIAMELMKMEQKILFERLFELYCYEFSLYENSLSLNDEGLYHPPRLESYFSDSSYEKYFIKADNNIAGFVIVHKTIESGFPISTISEFFVMKKYQGQGIGQAIAKQVFNLCPGHWQVRQHEKNYPSQAFWRCVIKEYTNNRFYEKSTPRFRRIIQEFHSQPHTFNQKVDEDITLKILEPKDAGPLFSLIQKSETYLREWLPWLGPDNSVDNLSSG